MAHWDIWLIYFISLVYPLTWITYLFFMVILDMCCNSHFIHRVARKKRRVRLRSARDPYSVRCRVMSVGFHISRRMGIVRGHVRIKWLTVLRRPQVQFGDCCLPILCSHWAFEEILRRSKRITLRSLQERFLAGFSFSGNWN